MNEPVDRWSEEVDQKRAERKTEPILEASERDEQVTTLYGEILAESSEVAQACEEGREVNNSAVRRMTKLLEQCRNDRYPPLSMWKQRRENQGKAAIDYCNELLNLVTEMKGNIVDDLHLARNNISNFNHIDLVEKRRRRAESGRRNNP